MKKANRTKAHADGLEQRISQSNKGNAKPATGLTANRYGKQQTLGIHIPSEKVLGPSKPT